MPNRYINKNSKQILKQFTLDTYNIDVYKSIISLHKYISDSIDGLTIENITNLYKHNRLIESRVMPSAAGKVIEDEMLKIIKKKYNIVGWPNGEMKFPDLQLNINNFEIPIDVKAVLCTENKKTKNISINYHNAIESQYEVFEKINKYIKDGKHSELTKSYILYVYYSVNDNRIDCIGCHIVSTLQTIKYDKTTYQLCLKSANRKTGIVKNSNVIIGLVQNEQRTYEQLKNDLSKLQLWH